MTEAEFVEKYGRDRAVAALAVLLEDETTGKKRVIHDATHGVGVNNRIRCQDKVRMPGPREKRALLEEFSSRRCVVLSLVGDFEKAHRRFIYREDERGFLACRVKAGDGIIYINKVGTFGVASTPYWWSRISGALMRCVYALLGSRWPIEMLLYADDLEVMAATREGRVGAVLCFLLMAALGAPFKWKKQRGGWVTEWVGLTTDYRTLSMGLSERRARWLVEWIGSLVERREVSEREFAAGLGRLSFSSLALPSERPLLGPLFAWSSAIRGARGPMALPWAVLFLLKWIASRLGAGMRMQKVEPEKEDVRKRVVIFTDAKATEERAWIGGWRKSSEDTKQCEWFSMEVKEDFAPWLRMRQGNPKRMIAALELLATLVALKLWLGDGDGDASIHTEAFTDNLGNDFILKRGLSTKYPLTVLLIEISEVLRAKNAFASLRWIRRDENQRADDLTNEEFGHFNMDKRITVDKRKVKWLVLDSLLEQSQELYDSILLLKEEKRKRKAALPKVKSKAKFFKRWDS